MKKKYYAITTSMTFEKTVMVPVEAVKDLDEALNLVDRKVEIADIILLEEDPECETVSSLYADENGIEELTDTEAALYQIVRKD